MVQMALDLVQQDYLVTCRKAIDLNMCNYYVIIHLY